MASHSSATLMRRALLPSRASWLGLRIFIGLLLRVPILLCLLQDQHLLQYVVNFLLAYKGCLCVCLFLLWQLSASVTILAKWLLGVTFLAVSIVVGVQ